MARHLLLTILGGLALSTAGCSTGGGSKASGPAPAPAQPGVLTGSQNDNAQATPSSSAAAPGPASPATQGTATLDFGGPVGIGDGTLGTNPTDNNSPQDTQQCFSSVKLDPTKTTSQTATYKFQISGNVSALNIQIKACGADAWFYAANLQIIASDGTVIGNLGELQTGSSPEVLATTSIVASSANLSAPLTAGTYSLAIVAEKSGIPDKEGPYVDMAIADVSLTANGGGTLINLNSQATPPGAGPAAPANPATPASPSSPSSSTTPASATIAFTGPYTVGDGTLGTGEGGNAQSLMQQCYSSLGANASQPTSPVRMLPFTVTGNVSNLKVDVAKACGADFALSAAHVKLMSGSVVLADLGQLSEGSDPSIIASTELNVSSDGLATPITTGTYAIAIYAEQSDFQSADGEYADMAFSGVTLTAEGGGSLSALPVQ